MHNGERGVLTAQAATEHKGDNTVSDQTRADGREHGPIEKVVRIASEPGKSTGKQIRDDKERPKKQGHKSAFAGEGEFPGSKAKMQSEQPSHLLRD